MEEFALMLTGVGYFAVLGLPTLGKATLSRSTRWLILVAGVVFVGAGVLLATHSRYPATWVVWVLPAIPIMVMISLMREHARQRDLGTPPAATPAIVGDVSSIERSESAPRRDDAAARDAADPASSAERLADLAYGHPELHALLAVNISTPASVLEWMASLGDPMVTGAIGERASHE